VCSLSSARSICRLADEVAVVLDPGALAAPPAQRDARMGRYHAKDLLLVPSLLSLARVPLALAFVLALNHPQLELAILIAAGGTDVVDGWYARRYRQVTATGAVVDPITDKVFVLTVVVALVLTARLSMGSVILLATREIGELPLVLWWALSHQRRRARMQQPMANIPGKLATCLQFLTVALALFRSPHTGELVLISAGAGAVAALAYWWRDLAASKTANGA
jgi:CDP-diacylglycerol--glycerol-3-phosphate 3-phosphatidyltransferase/cardiolipin synthase